jgi:NADH-ubiquinone oxidoreductase chain 1
MAGIAQPFRDAIKLFTKEMLCPFASNPKQFFVAPMTALVIVILTYLFFPFKETNFNLSLGVLFLYMMIRINVFPVIIGGWSSNSKYALVGRLRGIAQTVSYEVRFALILLFFLCLCIEINLLQVSYLNSI